MKERNLQSRLYGEGSNSKLYGFFRIAFTCSICLFLTFSIRAQNKLWLTAGGDPSNSRNAVSETKITPGNASQLSKKWTVTTDGDVSATPVVDGQAVYFPDWGPVGTSNGSLYKVNTNTGEIIWKKPFTSYTGQAKAFARASPAIAGNTLIIGTQLGFPFIGAHVLGINKVTGELLWKTKVEDFPLSIITQSAMVQGNRAYVGVASLEENFAADPTYPCCSFRGSMVCLDVNTGQIIWKTYMTPANKGFSGVAVWGSTPVVDVKRNSVYITTGNNYRVPQAALDCNIPGRTPDQVRACVMAVDGSSENYFDAIVALDLTTGAVKWIKSGIPFDAWNVSCFFDGPNCPDNAGPDYDFGQGAALFTVGSGTDKRELLGAGQKSGIYWTVNPDNGQEVWHTEVGPGGTLGGLQWGSAVDGNQVYTAVSNNGYAPHTMTKGPSTGRTVNGGFWAVLDASTGAVNWENAGVNPPVSIPGFPPPPAGAIANNTGAVTIANGVMFAGAGDAVGTMNAFNAATGEKLWSFESGGSINSGAAVVNGIVYWGSGYSNFGLGSPNNKFYAFQVGANNSITNVEIRGVLSNAIVSAKASLSIYPNPASDFIRITSNDNSKINAIRLYDITGRMIKQVNPSGSSEYKLDVSSVQKGGYMVQVSTSTMNQSMKVNVVH